MRDERASGADSAATPRSAADHAPTLSRQLPSARRGYDVAATDALLGELAARQVELEQESARLRAEVARLDQRAVPNQPEEVVGQALIAATSFAMKTREAARREAELALRNARGRVRVEQEAINRLATQREEAERELVRLRQLAQELRSSLAGFLKSTLDELRAGGDRGRSEPIQLAGAVTDESMVAALNDALQPEGALGPSDDENATTLLGREHT